MSASNRAVEFIRKAMDEREVSVNALAGMMGESQSTINRAIRGDVEITFERLYNICKVLHIDMQELFYYVETPAKKKRKA